MKNKLLWLILGWVLLLGQAAYSMDKEATLKMEGVIDRVVQAQLDTNHIPGAAVVVVKDGETIISKGYGYADLTQGKPVDPETTLFRIGSVSKLFTWTAVMQLVAEGHVDLDANIQSYLDFHLSVPPDYPPITMRHLMTHTGGFADSSRGMLLREGGKALSLNEFLKRYQPPLIYPAGEVTAYSNYGTALAGYIVERIAQKPYAEVIEQGIFEPLSMRHSTVSQPVPDKLLPMTASGYTFDGQQPVAQPFELMQMVGAGAASCSVTDMGNFMIAHLQQGQFGELAMLDEYYAQEMQRVHFRNHPQLSGMGLGFYQKRINGRLWLTHAGETSFFYSQLYLLPEEDLGVFVVYNSPGGRACGEELIQALCDQFYPENHQVLRESTPYEIDQLQRYAGLYVPSRRPVGSVEKIRQLVDPMFQPIRVRLLDAQTIQTTIPHGAVKGNRQTNYRALGEEMFLGVDGGGLVVFQGNKDIRLLMDHIPARGYDKLSLVESWLYNPLVAVLLLIGCLAFSLLALVSSPKGQVIRYLFLFTTVFHLLWFLALLHTGFHFMDLVYGETSLVLKALPFLLYLSAGLTGALLIWLLTNSTGGSLLTKLVYWLAGIHSLLLLAWAWFWELFTIIS